MQVSGGIIWSISSETPNDAIGYSQQCASFEWHLKPVFRIRIVTSFNFHKLMSTPPTHSDQYKTKSSSVAVFRWNLLHTAFYPRVFWFGCFDRISQTRIISSGFRVARRKCSTTKTTERHGKTVNSLKNWREKKIRCTSITFECVRCLTFS